MIWKILEFTNYPPSRQKNMMIIRSNYLNWENNDKIFGRIPYWNIGIWCRKLGNISLDLNWKVCHYMNVHVNTLIYSFLTFVLTFKIEYPTLLWHQWVNFADLMMMLYWVSTYMVFALWIIIDFKMKIIESDIWYMLLCVSVNCAVWYLTPQTCQTVLYKMIHLQTNPSETRISDAKCCHYIKL